MDKLMNIITTRLVFIVNLSEFEITKETSGHVYADISTEV